MIERLWWAAGWLGIALTLAFSLLPPVLDSSSGHTDKIVHCAGYAVLMFWWAQLVPRQRWKLAAAVVLLGVAIELLQGLTPNRQTDPLDALANSAGVVIGWLAARLLAASPIRPKCLATLPALRR